MDEEDEYSILQHNPIKSYWMVAYSTIVFNKMDFKGILLNEK